MINLNSVNKTLWAELSDEPNEPLEVVVSFVDITHLGNIEIQQHHAQLSRLAQTLAVSICDAPAANTARVIMSISVSAPFTADPLMLRVFFDNAGQEYAIQRLTMLNNEGLYYENGVGWYKMTAAGVRM